jgi:hypothetical protein
MLGALKEYLLDFGRYDPGLDAMAAIVTICGIVGLVIVIWQFARKLKHEREAVAHARRVFEEGIYNRIGDEWFKLNELMLKHPNLNASWFEQKPAASLSESEKKQQDILFDLTAGLLEATFLAYRHAESDQRKRQWDKGWSKYAEDYCRKRDFRKWWYDAGGVTDLTAPAPSIQFDEDFEDFMQECFRKAMVNHQSKGTEQ